MTAETALALPAVVLVLAVILGVGHLVTAQVQCVDAARAGARQAARGESAGTVTQVARAFGPQGARVTVTREGRTVAVEVAAIVRLPGTGWPVLPVRGRAVGEVEQP